MTKAELATLLGSIGLLDPWRKFDGAVDVEVWHKVVGDLNYRDADAAVCAFYRAASRTITAADLRDGVAAIRKARLEHAIDPLPDVDPDDERAYREALKAGRERQADGTERVRPVPQLLAGVFHPVPKPDYGTRRRFIPKALQDRSDRAADAKAAS